MPKNKNFEKMFEKLNVVSYDNCDVDRPSTKASSLCLSSNNETELIDTLFEEAGKIHMMYRGKTFILTDEEFSKVNKMLRNEYEKATK